ncbi:DUF4956 domain-containing protein [Galactobacillus timonensis]|uniref:DUF4956 domain-containing protein n=1 Tax=Galactobacillus timonensis TaxID=2041840 RepID=UPI00240A27B9|nr:DUF4956 domain-containing protein [Galactobacillus timonensis]MDD5851975.1 DUF4956 domain-containing protein [Galactobacillus timonensis]MDD6370349.1 DUF4956 domain-containing protein [Galactobacillus timonensis]
MFTSILSNSASYITFEQIALCFFGALLCGFVIALAYHMLADMSRSFALTLTLLPAIVMMVIMMVNGNLGVGVAVAGSFSLVRFRSQPGKASDIGVIFLAMGAGLACGMGYITFALAMVILCIAAAVLFSKLPLFSTPSGQRYLMIQVPEDLNYANSFDDLFEKYTSRAQLMEVRTTHMGMLNELQYRIDLKQSSQEQALINELRMRNGNLTIRSTIQAPVTTRL